MERLSDDADVRLILATRRVAHGFEGNRALLWSDLREAPRRDGQEA
ncbi:MAG: hypothetical protein AAB434_00355 [Planctomycetota bacterium]